MRRGRCTYPSAGAAAPRTAATKADWSFEENDQRLTPHSLPLERTSNNDIFPNGAPLSITLTSVLFPNSRRFDCNSERRVKLRLVTSTVCVSPSINASTAMSPRAIETILKAGENRADPPNKIMPEPVNIKVARASARNLDGRNRLSCIDPLKCSST
jgi:hypothetical protein